MILVYLSTFIGFTDVLLIPTVLLLGGLVLQVYIHGKLPHDPSFDEREVKSMLIHVVIAVAAMGLASLLIPGLFAPKIPAQLAINEAYMLTSLYAVSEERFFRGGVNSFLFWKMGRIPMAVNIASGVIFGVYHLSVYGTSLDKIIYVMMAGVILSFVTLRSGRLAPAIIAHGLNNVWSLMGML